MDSSTGWQDSVGLTCLLEFPVQQLSGVDDRPFGLTELKVLVERARRPVTVRFGTLGCAVDTMMVIGISDASFAGMPRGRSQGGMVIAFANPDILEGPSNMSVLTTPD